MASFRPIPAVALLDALEAALKPRLTLGALFFAFLVITGHQYPSTGPIHLSAAGTSYAPELMPRPPREVVAAQAAPRMPETTTTVPSTTLPPEPTTTAPPDPTPVVVDDSVVEDAIRTSFGGLYQQAVNVARCESNLNPSAVSKGGGNWGLFQINTVHRDSFQSVTGHPWSDVLDPYLNAQFAAWLYDQSGWGPWTCGYAA